MKATARLFGHPIHQMLIVFPLGVLGMSFFFDIAYMITRRSELETAAFWMIFAGVISGLVAAVFGLIDWLGIPRKTRAKRIGVWHGGGNVVVVGLFIGSWYFRRPIPTEAKSDRDHFVSRRCGNRVGHGLARRRARRPAWRRSA